MATGAQSSRESAGLSISDLAAATGVSAATLRAWETRHGYPRPDRLPGGHRRYPAGAVAVIDEIVRLRDRGQTLTAAVAAALARDDRTEQSVFAGLRRAHPELAVRTVDKATMLALTRAIEDECCARAEDPLLFAGFQQERFYDRSRVRWGELARTASATAVFADFADPPPGTRPLHVTIPPDSPLLREWFLVCDAPDHPACVAAWEIPGQAGVPDARRRFEVLWSVDPQAVRDAARVCAALAESLAPGTVFVTSRLSDVPPPASADLRRASGLLDRTLGYLDSRDQPGRGGVRAGSSASPRG